MGSRAPGSSRDVLGDGVRSSRILIISGWGRELQARCGRELLGGEGPEMEGPGRPAARLPPLLLVRAYVEAAGRETQPIWTAGEAEAPGR